MEKVERLNLPEIECLKTIISEYKLPCELILGYDDGKYRCLCSDTICGTNLNNEGEGKVYSITEGVREIILPAIQIKPDIMKGLPLEYFAIIMNLGYDMSGNWISCTDMLNLFVAIGYGKEVV